MSAYWDLALGFFRSGIFGYGGGPSVIPLIHYEAVNKYKWMEDEEFAEVLAMANALPGPIATKMAAYIGYRVKGTMGATVAILSHIFLSVIVLIVLLGSLYALKGSHIVEGMIVAVKPVIAVMLGVMAYDFFLKAWKGLGIVQAIVLTVVALVALQVLNIHPAIVIVLFMAYAVWQSTRAAKVKRKQPPLGTGSNQGEASGQ